MFFLSKIVFRCFSCRHFSVDDNDANFFTCRYLKNILRQIGSGDTLTVFFVDSLLIKHRTKSPPWQHQIFHEREGLVRVGL